MNAQQRRLRAQIAAHSMHARHDVHATTAAGHAAARAAFEERFLDAVDHDRVLPIEERQRRARHARKAYFLRLSLAGVRARTRDRKQAA